MPSLDNGKKHASAFFERSVDVMLVSMPFGVVRWPSMGLSLLKTILTDQTNFSVETTYFNCRFAQIIGIDSYLRFADEAYFLDCYNQIGEWVFAGALFDRSEMERQQYINTILYPSCSFEDAFIETLCRIEQKVEGFLDECLQYIARHNPAVIGFTCFYQQTLASLALAKRIKKGFPSLKIIFGGPGCEGVMGAELAHQFPFVDAVVSGEGEVVVITLVEKLLRDEPLPPIPGVHTHFSFTSLNQDCPKRDTRPPLQMDQLPYLDFDDYYLQIAEKELELPYYPSFLYETSRGCWWGQSKQCLFCGLLGTNLTFRSKSGKRALEELLHLYRKYPGKAVFVSDNNLDPKYFSNFIPELAKRKLDIEILYNVRTTLEKEQLIVLRDAGVTMLQPGIENLSTSILALIRKEISSLQNIQFLKWCRELGLTPFWNFLYGFPYEKWEEYEDMAQLIPLLVHLEPPQRCQPFFLSRFSPYFEQADELGLENITPAPAYRFLYPFEPATLANLAYHFAYQYRNPNNDRLAYTRSVRQNITDWQKNHSSSYLYYTDNGHELSITDQRELAIRPMTLVTGLERLLLLELDRNRSINELQDVLNDQTGQLLTTEQIKEFLTPLLDAHFVLKEKNRYLALPVAGRSHLNKQPLFERLQEHKVLYKKLKRQVDMFDKVRVLKLDSQNNTLYKVRKSSRV